MRLWWWIFKGCGFSLQTQSKLKVQHKGQSLGLRRAGGLSGEGTRALRNVQPIRNNDIKVMVTSEEESLSDFNESIERPLKSSLKKEMVGVNNEIMT